MAKKASKVETYDVKQTAEILGISTHLVYEGIRKKQIPFIQVGRLYRIPKAGLHRLTQATT